MIQKTEQLKDLLDRGFVLFSKNGIIESAKLPEFGSLTITMQDGRPVYQEVLAKTKFTAD
ncbi:hypothetical protein D8857_07630 [Streptococcus oralis]|uniref:DUF2292 domain-containing protein n=1 Tax=Streptococcus oralis TaxID=1303 RepID=A0A428BZL9_STROR|nr:hypothetical protein [Streptococcus oralis]RKV76313.1 MAG: hypothetical protein D8H99_53975 [Streptococcus sp.]RSI71227.1 hypothetical protein D8857_07630 [Streptococcus oralis]